MEKQSSLRRLLGYGGKFKYLTMASWALSAISALLALLPFVYIWKIIKEVLAVAPDFGAAQHLASYGWLAVLCAGLSLIVYVGGLLCSHLGAFRVAAVLRSRAMAHIVTLPLGFMDDFGSGKLRKIINESSAATETYLAHQLPDKAGAIATPCGMLVLLFIFDWRLGLLSLIPVVLAFLIMMAMTGKGMREKMNEYQNALEDMSNEAVEYVRGIAVVKTFGQTIFSFKRFKGSIDHYEEWVIAYTKKLRTPMIIYTTAINGIFAVLIAAALVMTGGGVSQDLLLNLLFYIIFTPIITVTLTKIMYASENSLIVDDALKRIDSVLKLTPMAKSMSPAKPTDSSVTLEHVSFRYHDKKHDALSDVSLHVAAGSQVALVGPSGSGKTTLGGVVARFWDVPQGRVLIGGADVRDIPKEDLMDQVSFVFQDSMLLKTSILENVRLSRPGASREKVLAALHAAQCDDIIAKLPHGVDTIIGSSGTHLSGGEQQRLAIARVILKDAPIVILDEATAYADPDNEDKIQAAFRELGRDKTVITIAHRLSSVVNVDRIYLLSDGSVQEQGSHEELLAAGGAYARMWQDYQRAARWKVEKEVEYSA